MNRRDFLGNTVAAVPAAGLVLTPILAAGTLAENLELLRLAPELDAAEAAFLAADAFQREAIATYQRICPETPEDLVIGRHEREWFCGVPERDIEGKDVFRGLGGRQRRISTTEYLQIACEDYGSRTKAGREARRRLKIAWEFDRAKARAEEVAGVEKADRARRTAGWALERIASAIGDTEARTFEGVALKARAMLAASQIDNVTRMRAAFIWGVPLAEAVAALSAGFPQPVQN